MFNMIVIIERFNTICAFFLLQDIHCPDLFYRKPTFSYGSSDKIKRVIASVKYNLTHFEATLTNLVFPGVICFKMSGFADRAIIGENEMITTLTYFFYNNNHYQIK